MRDYELAGSGDAPAERHQSGRGSGAQDVGPDFKVRQCPAEGTASVLG